MDAKGGDKMYAVSKAEKIIGIMLYVFICLSQVSCSYGNTLVSGWGQGKTVWQGVNVFASTIRAPQGNLETHYRLASYYQERGRHKEAIEEFNKVILIDPLHVKAHNGLGISYSELKDYSKSMSAYQMALKHNPKLDYVFNNIGYSCLLMGNIDGAIDALRNAAALNKWNRRIHNNLAVAYLMKGDTRTAGEEFDIGGGGAFAAYNAAQVYYRNNMFHEAREHFARVLEMDPSLDKAREGLEASEMLERISLALMPTQPAGSDEILRTQSGTTQQSDSMRWLEHVEIEISNGNGVRHMARYVGLYLKKRGFNVVRLTNASHFNHTKGSITCSEAYVDAARAIIKNIPQLSELTIADMQTRGSVKVRVLVGKDLIPYHDEFRDDRS